MLIPEHFSDDTQSAFFARFAGYAGEFSNDYGGQTYENIYAERNSH